MSNSSEPSRPSDPPPSASLESYVAAGYESLRHMAHAMMRGEASTLQPTALVHEAYLKVRAASIEFKDTHHFLGRLSLEMRGLMISHFRAARAKKRSPGGERIPLDDVVRVKVAPDFPAVDLEELDTLLARIRAADAFYADVIELRLCCQLQIKHIAKVYNVSESSVARAWAVGSAQLRRHIKGWNI